MFNSPYSNYSYSNPYGVPNYQQRAYAPQPQPQVQQPIQMQMQPQQPIAPQVPQIQEFRHGTEDEIRPIIIYPNCVAYYIDYSKGRMYAKRADGAGMSSFEYYELTPVNADGTPIKPQEATPQIDFAELDKKFATVEQYNSLLDQFKQLKQMIGGKQNVTNTKQTEQRV